MNMNSNGTHIQDCAFIFLLLACSFVNPHVHQIGNLLHASSIKEFPSGTYENIKIINFQNNNLRVIKSYTFYKHKFYNLEKVILRNNNISHIYAYAFGLMSKITQLDLHGNKLAAFHRNTFKGLESLRTLHLSNNTIPTINEEMLIPLESLQILDLSYNIITTLSKTFLKKNSVSELNLNGNPLIFPEEDVVLESSTLTHLYLQSCNLHKLPEAAFNQLPNLEAIDLSRNKLQVLPYSLLKKVSNLKYFDVSFNLITYLDTNIFYFPTDLDAFYCIGNPFKGDIDCTQLLLALQNEFDENKKNELEIANNKGAKKQNDTNENTTEDIVIQNKPTDKPDFSRFISVYEKTEKSSEETFTLVSKLKRATAQISTQTNDKEKTEGKELANINISAENHQDGNEKTVTKHLHEYVPLTLTNNHNFVDRNAVKEEHIIFTINSSTKSKLKVSDVIIYSIIVVSIICLILLIIILGELYYLKKQYEKRKRNISLNTGW